MYHGTAMSSLEDMLIQALALPQPERARLVLLLAETLDPRGDGEASESRAEEIGERA